MRQDVIRWSTLGLALLIVVLSACVSRGAHEAALQEIRSLKADNSALRSAPAARRESPQARHGNGEPTNNQRLHAMLSATVQNIQGRAGSWQVLYRAVPMMIFTSEAHDRMRIIAPVSEESDLDSARLGLLMHANFDKALDARYALFQGKLWSVYLHPLSSLTEEELHSALDQVANLRLTYGSTYSSGNLRFQ